MFTQKHYTETETPAISPECKIRLRCLQMAMTLRNEFGLVTTADLIRVAGELETFVQDYEEETEEQQT